MRILIIGAGAVGGFYGAKLTLSGEDVTFLARGAAADVLKHKDLVVRSYQGDFQARVKTITTLDGYSSPDLLILAIKSYDTAGVIDQIRPVVGADTLLLSFQNGVENEILLEKSFGRERVLGCVCYIGAEAIEPGVILHSARGTVSIGEWDGSRTPRLEKLIAAFQRANIDTKFSGNIQADLWTKLAWNTAFNQVCTVAHAKVGDVLDSEILSDLLINAMLEVVAIGKASGVDLAGDLADKHMLFSREELRSVKPSMLQDHERGRRLEHETFSGFLVREGRRLGIPTPVNALLHEILKFYDR